jgi:parallel beta-helix repeat protein
MRLSAFVIILLLVSSLSFAAWTGTKCDNITGAGTYYLYNNVVGAPNDALPKSGSACVKIAASNILFDCNGYNITNNGTGGYTYGIILNGSLTNVTVRNCPGISTYSFGIYAYYSNYSVFTNNTIYNTSNNAIYLESGNFNNVSGNVVHDTNFLGTNWTGIYLYSCSNILINNNAAYDTYNGIATVSDANDTITNNKAYSNPINGFILYGASNTVFSNNTAFGNAQNGFEIYAGSINSTLINNSAYNNSYYGFYLYSSSNNVLNKNAAYNNSEYGFYLQSSSNNTFTSNSAYNNSFIGFVLWFSSHDIFSNNSASGSNTGVYLFSDAGNNTFINNLAYSDSSQGFWINSNTTYTSDDNLFANNTAYNNTGAGFAVISSSNNILANNTAYKNGQGLAASASINNTFANNTLFNNTYGAYFINSFNVTEIHDHLFSNRYDFRSRYTSGASQNINISGVVFDNPGGDHQNYTDLSLVDTMESFSDYIINWSAQMAAPNPGFVSFRQKFVNITALAGAPSIDSITWSWDGSELAGYYETRLELWKYNTTGNWTKTNATLDMSANTFTLTNTIPGSIYGILENDVLPNVSLQIPVAGYNASKRFITFNCSASSSNTLSNITLYGNFTGSWQANQTDSVGGLSNSAAFTLILPYGKYGWNCLAYDTGGRSAWAPANYTLTANSVPIYSDFGGSTTDFNSELDLQNVSTPVLENSSYGRLQWNGNGLDVAGADFNSYVHFGNGWVAVDSSNLNSTLNSSANITLNNLPYQYTPIVYADGAICQGCNITSYVSHNLAFSVPHFTNYSTGPNTNLSIYSQYEGGNVSKLTDITFYANYTNATDGSHVAGATCLINFDDATSAVMLDTGSQYNYTKVAGFAFTGIHLWSITCNKTGYETLTAFDGIVVGPLNLSGNTTSLYMANVTNATPLPRFVSNQSGNFTTEGGNITGGNIGTEQLTDRWAAFYGNISGSVILTDKAGANDVYLWGWFPTAGGVVCTSTNSTVTDVKLYPADGDDIDVAWSFAHTEADSGRNTFNQTGCSLTIGITPITNASYADTGQPGGFITCSLKDTIAPAKPDMYFCTSIAQNGTFWNGQTGNFELMVPTAFGNNAYETYYFYVNLN